VENAKVPTIARREFFLGLENLFKKLNSGLAFGLIWFEKSGLR
jgi:hypothetical protein